MKNLYIPKGKTLHYEALACRNIVNDGVLIVENSIQARHISGKGVLDAGSITCRSLTAADIDAAHITTGKLAAERVCASEVRVSGAAVVSCRPAYSWPENRSPAGGRPPCPAGSGSPRFWYAAAVAAAKRSASGSQRPRSFRICPMWKPSTPIPSRPYRSVSGLNGSSTHC